MTVDGAIRIATQFVSGGLCALREESYSHYQKVALVALHALRDSVRTDGKHECPCLHCVYREELALESKEYVWGSVCDKYCYPYYTWVRAVKQWEDEHEP